MHAVVGQVNIESGREDESVEFLKANVLPMVKQSPGLISGFWMAPQGGQGVAVVLYESEEAARSAAETAMKAPRPEYVTPNFEVREVIAQV
jgi:hypothetical protein